MEWKSKIIATSDESSFKIKNLNKEIYLQEEKIKLIFLRQMNDSFIGIRLYALIA